MGGENQQRARSPKTPVFWATPKEEAGDFDYRKSKRRKTQRVFGMRSGPESEGFIGRCEAMQQHKAGIINQRDIQYGV